MNTTTIIDKLHRDKDLSKDVIHDIVTSFLAEVRETLIGEETVTLRTLGTLSVKEKKGRMYNVKGVQYDVEDRKTIKFVPSKPLIKVIRS